MKIWVNDGETPKPDDKFWFELADNGIFLHKQMPFWNAVVPVEKISSLEKREPELELKLPKIPAELVKDVIRFFAWIYRKQRTEVAALIWYNESLKKYRISIPKQEVSFASIKYDIQNEFKEGAADGYCLVGTFHSHSSMSAFHSGVDKRDEESFDGIHFTFGDFSDSKTADEISMSAEAAINGTRFKLNLTDYLGGIESLSGIKDGLFNDPKKKESFLEKWSFVSEFRRDNKFKIPGELILPEDYQPNKDWEARVGKNEWKSTYHTYSGGGVGFATKREDSSPANSPREYIGEEAWGDDMIVLDRHPDKIRLDTEDRSKDSKKKHKKRK